MIVQTIEVTSAGGTYNIDLSVQRAPDVIFIYATGTVTLVSDFIVNITAISNNSQFRFVFQAVDQIDINGNAFTVNGQSYTNEILDLIAFQEIYTYINGTIGFQRMFVPTLDGVNPFITGSQINDDTITLAKLTGVTNGQIIVGNGSDVATAVTPTGDISISNTGVTAIAAGAIVNADVNASAGIARTKLASGTAAHVVINDGSGVMTSEATLSPVRGGLGTDASAATGFVKFSAGTASVASVADCFVVPVSFESGEVGDFKITVPFACTITGLYAYATKAIAGTDNATIVPKNNAGTTMTDGTITFTASDARGTAYTSTPSANNTFTAGQILTLTCAKVTVGGMALVTVSYTRTA